MVECMGVIRILLADDHPVVREGIRNRLDGEEDCLVVGEAVNGDEAVSLARRLCPDVVLLDLGLPDVDGLQVLSMLRSVSPVPVIVITARDDDAEVVKALDAGADDCVSGEESHELYCVAEDLHAVASALEERFGEPNAARIVWKPQSQIPADDETGEKVLRMIDALENNDDVQSVYANFDISEEVLERIGA